MDAGNIIYLIAVIIYFIYSALKKNKPEQIEDSENPSTDSPQQRPASFEDLLREIRQGQQEAQKDLDQSGQGDVLEERRPKPSKRAEPAFEPFSKASLPKEYSAYQGAIDEDFKSKYKTLDEQIRLSSPIEGLKSGGIVASKNRKVQVNKYARMLQNPNSVRDAVVLSEVLKRKF